MGTKEREWWEKKEEQIEWDKQEKTTKGKAAPAGEAQSRWRKPSKLCEELLLQLEVRDNLQKEQKAYSKAGLSSEQTGKRPARRKAD